MNSEEIRIELFKVRKTKSMSDIAKDLGVSRSHVTQVVKRKFPSRRVKLAVAKAIGRDPREVWPEEPKTVWSELLKRPASL
ncbi:MAG: helix-turn-helix domain-containing protein [Desulfobacteraceae bacterium]|jgi:lambda repressor-like predicted transcriptional regulator